MLETISLSKGCMAWSTLTHTVIYARSEHKHIFQQNIAVCWGGGVCCMSLIIYIFYSVCSHDISITVLV